MAQWKENLARLITMTRRSAGKCTKKLAATFRSYKSYRDSEIRQKSFPLLLRSQHDT